MFKFYRQIFPKVISRFLCLIALLFPHSMLGSSFNIEDYKGKVVYLDFWASWCGPCKESFPWMNEMHTQYEKDGLVIIAVNLDANSEDMDAFLKQHPAKFQILADPKAQLAEEMQVQAMPTSFLFDRQGEFVKQELGFRKKKAPYYEEALKKALGK